MEDYRTRCDIKILIIEDETVIAMALKLRLQRAGYCVCNTAANEKQALRIFGNENPDIVLTDIMLADGDNGILVAGELKKAVPQLPIIFLTGYELDDIKESAMELTPLGFFIKPIDLIEVSKVIDEFFKITS